jgi:hypothetical protein
MRRGEEMVPCPGHLRKSPYQGTTEEGWVRRERKRNMAFLRGREEGRIKWKSHHHENLKSYNKLFYSSYELDSKSD